MMDISLGYTKTNYIAIQDLSIIHPGNRNSSSDAKPKIKPQKSIHLYTSYVSLFIFSAFPVGYIYLHVNGAYLRTN